MSIISLAVSSAVLPVTSSSHTFSDPWAFRASTKQTSRISEARFSQSFCPAKPFFSMSLRSSTGSRLRTKIFVTNGFGVTAAA